MEIELWWLLIIPLFFLLGWLAARIDIRHVVRESKSLPRSYLSGLNFLLNEQPDKAIDAFIEAVRIDPDTVELHFALGSLFRRRGETERAIRMHQHLVDRVDLPQSQRTQALAELGQDYLKAGLLDRAEDVFVRLRGSDLDDMALNQLLEIYQQEKEWGKAIDIAQALPDHESVWWRKEMANFHCEIAENAMTESHFADAAKSVDAALSVKPKSVRASLLRGDLLQRDGKLDAAIDAWKRIETQDPAYLALVAERLTQAHQKQSRAVEGLQMLRAFMERHPSLDLLDTVFEVTLKMEGAEPAYELVREELRRNPTLLGLDKLLEAGIMTAPDEYRTDIELVRQLVHGHTRRVARYRCGSCGFKARQFYWRCPACGGWETTPPKRTEEYDLAP